jgi:TolB-like protein/DNA-binding winged helix-turn-helix (wHTH) protein
MPKELTTRSAPAAAVCFGPFEFDPRSGELRKHGLRIKLQGQPVELLTTLLQHAGEVVTRDQLQKRLWPADTYVDFEHSLNSAMKRLRTALGDSADAPRYIETLARRGYRFIAPIRQPEEGNVEGSAATTTPDQVRAEQSLPGSRRWLIGVGIAMATAGVLAMVGTSIIGAGGKPGNRSSSASIHSLVVLPLANVSGDRSQDYFAEEMTDALRHHLEGISSLRVISRTSSMHYRASGKRLQDIARELNVDAVVDGSVSRSGNRVRIDVELFHAGMDRQLWSNSYEGDLRDIFALQARVVGKIADEIRVTLTPPERARLARVRAFNPDAYQAYSKGRFFWNKRTEPDLKKAIAFFQQAIDEDPSYALAYDGLADSWIPLGWYGFLPPSETFPHAREAISKALDLDDSLAEAHTSLAFVKLYYDRDWTRAELEFRRGIDLNPNYANGHHWYAEFLSLAGRHKQAIEESEHARELDPLSNIINAWVSSRYFYARDFDHAIEEGRNAVEMDANFGPAHLVLGHAYEQKGMLKEAIREFETASTLAGGGSMYRASLAHAFGRAGRRSEARKVLQDLVKAKQRGFISAYDLAIAEIGLGEKEKVFEFLAQAIGECSPRAAFLGVEPRFDSFRTDPRFRDLLRSLGLGM